MNKMEATQAQALVVSLNSWTKGTIKRIYVNDANGRSVGYWQSRFGSQPRDLNNSYDRHRFIKEGSMANSEWSELVWVGEEGMDSKILTAIEAQETDQEKANTLDWRLSNACQNTLPYHLAIKAKSKWTAENKREAKAIANRTFQVTF